MAKRVKAITYNWHQFGNLSEGLRENWSSYEIGKFNVTRIEYHVHWAHIWRNNKLVATIHNINSVEYYE